MGRIGRGTLTVVAILLVLFLGGCNPVALRTYIERMTGFGDVIYVSIADGNDSNRGVFGEPLATIQAGIDKAYGYIQDGLAATVEVRVAEGTYEVNYRAGNWIQMKEGVSLYGGYSIDFSERNPVAHATTIIDRSSSGGLVGDTNQAVTAGEGITLATVLDGFTVVAGEGDLSTALYMMNSSPTITNNTFMGGGAATFSAAVSAVDNARPLIEGNVISGGGSPGMNVGVLALRNALPVIQANIIDGGNLANTVGVAVNNGANVTVQDNTISGGHGTTTAAIKCWADSHMLVRWNLIDGGTASDTSHGIWDMGAGNTIEENTITGGSAQIGPSYGIRWATDAAPRINNNTVFGGQVSGTNDAIAIQCEGGYGLILNNTIAGGLSDWSAGIMLINGATPQIANNIIFEMSSVGGCCIYERDDNGGYAASICNNTLWDVSGTTILYHTWKNENLDILAEIEPLGHASGIWVEDPEFADADGADDDIATIEDNDWHLTASSPKEVRQGGRNGAAQGWGYTTDKDGATRTNLTQGPDDGPTNIDAEGWSMGAYEED